MFSLSGSSPLTTITTATATLSDIFRFSMLKRLIMKHLFIASDWLITLINQIFMRKKNVIFR